MEASLVSDELNLRDQLRCFANDVSERRLKVDVAALKRSFKTGKLDGMPRVDGGVNLADALRKNSPGLGKAPDRGRLEMESFT